jgi:hypothetical protein
MGMIRNKPVRSKVAGGGSRRRNNNKANSTTVASETGKTTEKKMPRTPWDEKGQETTEEANSRQNKKMIKIGDMCGSKTKTQYKGESCL